MDEYETASRSDRQTIGLEVMAIIAKESGRFLKQIDSGWWVQVDEDDSLKKVSNIFRSEKSSAIKAVKVVPGDTATDANQKTNQVNYHTNAAKKRIIASVASCETGSVLSASSNNRDVSFCKPNND